MSKVEKRIDRLSENSSETHETLVDAIKAIRALEKEVDSLNRQLRLKRTWLGKLIWR